MTRPRSPRRRPPLGACGCLVLALACGDPPGPPAARRDLPDAYADYLRRAPELQPLSQTPGNSRWDTWLYMPWRYRWTIGTGDEGGRFSRRYGINGGMTDHGRGPLAWLERWGLRFYNDHTAGKGDLFLMKTPNGFDEALADPRAIRPRPLDEALARKLEETIARNVGAIRQSPMRVAYALDDEISWGVLARPAVWRVNADDGAYARWLSGYYGGAAPAPRFVGPEHAFDQLGRPLREIDLSPFLDRMTYNDSVWANLIGRLVERCHREDPATPCGFVGGQAPGLFGGYDYARIAKKVGFIEAYDLGSSQEILRSLAPDVPRVTTHFHDDRRGTGNDVWLAWHYFAHGHRGMIGWVDESWFEGGRPRPWLARFGATLKELGGVQGPKMTGARWLHDGVALYYSHPSVQVSWCLDAAPHGKTWPKRNEDHRLGTSHNVRRAWQLLLEDAGLQYDVLAYDQVALRGVPKEYRVLILPACYALSDAEARHITDFAEAGGAVVADFACGLFDPHGRGRERGALDPLFGVRHDGGETREDFFGGRLWTETDQDKGYGFRRYAELFATVRPRLHEGFAIAERRLPAGSAQTVRAGRGRAVYLNLSPQRYLQYREEGEASEALRRPFLAPVLAGGARPWLEATAAGLLLEATYWTREGRTLVFVLQNAPIAGTSTGRGGADGLVETVLPVEVRLAGPVAGVIDERTGKSLPDGDRFTFRLDATEAVFFSFAGDPPRPAPQGDPS